MPPSRLSLPLLVLGLALLAVRGPVVAEPPSPPAFTPEQVALYETDVRPILKASCLKCHGDDPKKIKGGLNLTSRKATLAGGETGPAVDLARPADSVLLKAVHYKDEAMQMPPAGKLPDDKIAVLEKWVAAGLPWTPGGDDAATTHHEPKPTGPDPNYWAYVPVKRPAVPAVKDAAWVKTPIDAFVLSKLEAKGLKPVGQADKAALCRRAYYDLTGLPPTPERIDAFVADPSPDAFARLVDELLASPHYGEKWGRHWLDVVRFAETNGYERDGPKPFAWRYRDYVIRAFNADKPFDRFVKEQLAGDEIDRDDPDCVTATGFYRLGLWDDEPADKQLALFDGFDDLVTVAGQGLLGMSLNCARCHDHKGDFFPQADYYKMVAFFRDLRPFSDGQNVQSPNNTTDVTPPDRRKVYEAEFRDRQEKIAALTRQIKPIEDEAIARMDPKDQLAVQDGKRGQVIPKVPDLLAEPVKTRYDELKRQRKELERKATPSQTLVLSVNNCYAKPPATHLLIRGNPGSPGKEVSPGFPSVFGKADPAIPAADGKAKSSGRRTVLADWVASKDNPLTARVFVNRVWQWHFGRGLVPTSNDFGKLGEPCSHPELLDYLAADFVENGWTLKRLHRQLMLSSVYQLSAAADPANMKTDPANVLHWRFDMRRLTAEEVRDSILTASGCLNLNLFGPSVYPKISKEVLAGQSKPGEGWGTSPPAEANRRSVYVYVKRSLQVPVLQAHDVADTDSSCPVRYTTTVPTQALGMLNGEFTNEQARTLAARLAKEHPGDLPAQVARGIRLTTGRVPSADEVARDAGFVRSMAGRHKLDEDAALARYALLLLNANEFVYLD